MAELTDREQQALTDGQDIHDMMQTPGWRKFVKRLEDEIEAFRGDLESDKTPLEWVPFVRGELKALRWALRVPDGFVARRKEVLEKEEPE